MKYTITAADYDRDEKGRITTIYRTSNQSFCIEAKSKREAAEKFCDLLDKRATMPHSVPGYYLSKMHRKNRKIVILYIENDCISQNGITWGQCFYIAETAETV